MSAKIVVKDGADGGDKDSEEVFDADGEGVVGKGSATDEVLDEETVDTGENDAAEIAGHEEEAGADVFDEILGVGRGVGAIKKVVMMKFNDEPVEEVSDDIENDEGEGVLAF